MPEPLIAIWTGVGIVWAVVTGTMFLLEREEPVFDVDPRLWARLLLATPIWPIAGAILLRRLILAAYRHATYRDGDDR